MFYQKDADSIFMGIYSGLPLLLVGSTLQAWMREPRDKSKNNRNFCPRWDAVHA